MTPEPDADVAAVRSWRVHWQDVNDGEKLAWFQATRIPGGAPPEGQEVVPAEEYDRLAARLQEAEREIEAAKKQADALVAVDIGYEKMAEIANLRSETVEACEKALREALGWIKANEAGEPHAAYIAIDALASDESGEA